MTKEINIGKDFSNHPIGRFYSDGDSSGEKFREEVLKPLLKTMEPGQKIVVVLDDGVDGYGSSFLVEAFAAAVKHGYCDNSQLDKFLEFKYRDEDFGFYEKKIRQYIKEAKFNSEKYEQKH